MAVWSFTSAWPGRASAAKTSRWGDSRRRSTAWDRRRLTIRSSTSWPSTFSCEAVSSAISSISPVRASTRAKWTSVSASWSR